MIEYDPQFLHEVWALYGVGVAIILLRFVVRMKTVGVKGFEGDDCMAVLVLAFYTMDAATVHIIYYTGTNVEASALQLTRELTGVEIATFEFGSKEQLAAWYSYITLIWCMKGQMVFFFYRLTIGLWQQKLVKWLGLACGLSYLAVVLTVTFGCFPTHKNWQVTPDPGPKCTLKLQNFIVTVILNVLTDAAILAIPVPLLWKLKVDLKRKLVIFLLLSSGIFVITAAIIRVVLTLGAHPSALNINRWGVRETIIGIITINIPILRPLFSSNFWSTSPYKSSSGSGGSGGGTSHNKPRTRTDRGNSRYGKSQESFERIGEEDSQELIRQGRNPISANRIGGDIGGVTVHTSYEVMSEDIEKGVDYGYENSNPPWLGNLRVGSSRSSVRVENHHHSGGRR